MADHPNIRAVAAVDKAVRASEAADAALVQASVDGSHGSLLHGHSTYVEKCVNGVQSIEQLVNTRR